MAVSSRTGPGVLLWSGPVGGERGAGFSPRSWPHLQLWGFLAFVSGGCVGVGGHLSDLAAV